MLTLSYYSVFHFKCSQIIHYFQVSATDPDCGVNAIVNYTIGDGNEKFKEFTIRSDTGEICISSELDYETRNTYEFPVIATDRGKRIDFYLQFSYKSITCVSYKTLIEFHEHSSRFITTLSLLEIYFTEW